MAGTIPASFQKPMPLAVMPAEKNINKIVVKLKKYLPNAFKMPKYKAKPTDAPATEPIIKPDIKDNFSRPEI